MNRSILISVLLAVTAVKSSFGITTADQFDLQLDDNGQVTTFKLDDQAIKLAKNHALLQLRDVGQPWHAVSLHGPEVEASITCPGPYLQIDGKVIETTGQDRCVDLKISLPIDITGYALGDKFGDGKPLRKEKSRASDFDIDTSDGTDDSIYPVISASSASAGFSMAVPPTHPTRFLTGMDQDGLFILLRIGLSKDSAEPSYTPFRVIIYRSDPNWGARSALARYYEFYREPFFVRHVNRIGAWSTQNPSKLRNPEFYAYHAAGFATWHTPEGTESGVNVKPSLELRDEHSVCNSLAEYEKLCELELDKKLGIYALPYTIVGQRQILQLPKLPENYEAAMSVLQNWTTANPIIFDGQPQAVSFRNSDELKTIIRNSSLHDPQDHLTYVARPYRGPTLTFVQNPDPKLYRDNDKETIAKYTLDYYLPMMFTSKFVDGCYTDSLGRWCGFYNYCHDHWRYAGVPLTYAGNSAKPCLWNLQSHFEYLQELGRRMHAQNKIFITNGVHPTRVMLGFVSDVMGGEGTPSYDSEGFYALRVAAGAKPYCFLNATHKTSPRLWNSCLYMGFLMGCNTDAGVKDEKKYMPMIIAINKAGWQPVTYARANQKEIGIERWGEGKAVYFSIMNRSKGRRIADIEVDFKALGMEKHYVADVFKNTSVEISGDPIHHPLFHIPLEADETTVIKLEAQ